MKGRGRAFSGLEYLFARHYAAKGRSSSVNCASLIAQWRSDRRESVASAVAFFAPRVFYRHSYECNRL